MTMLRCCEDVNLDNQAVGWYQSTYMGSFVNLEMIETQFDYQQNIKQSIVIVYGMYGRCLLFCGISIFIHRSFEISPWLVGAEGLSFIG
jgi:hypothetical protein